MSQAEAQVREFLENPYFRVNYDVWAKVKRGTWEQNRGMLKDIIDANTRGHRYTPK